MSATAVTERKSEGGGVAQGLKDFSGRLKGFYTEVRTEMKKVTHPTLKETRATTIVVLATVMLFGVYFFLLDQLFIHSLDALIAYFSRG